MSIFSRWFRRGGKEPDPTIGLQIGLLAGAVGANEATREHESDSAPDYGWSGDHMSGGGSDYGGGGDFGGGFDGGGGDSGGGGI
jgi:uncharacterized membrane protein YgcG